MTVEQLIVVLQQFRPDQRVVVPGREFGMADVGEVVSRRFSFYLGGDDAMGNWMPHLLRNDRHRERCVLIEARPSSARRRQATT